jgi:hypothetical protein
MQLGPDLHRYSPIAALGAAIRASSRYSASLSSAASNLTVGSLPRPPDLLDLMKARAGGQPYDVAAYASRVRDAVADSVRAQVESGLDVVTDGGRASWAFSLISGSG